MTSAEAARGHRHGVHSHYGKVHNKPTPRERAVHALAAAGQTNRQIGTELFISDKTVSVHLSRVMAKLGASSRTEAVSVAYTRGLLEPVAPAG